jgi:uncharacterized damage-inducible protein DinB
MIATMKPMSGELEQEAVTTKRVLERVPEDKLGWKPHPKSMSLGELAMHVARIPGDISRLAQVDEFEFSSALFEPPKAKSKEEILAALDASVQTAQDYLGGVSEAAVAGTFRTMLRGKEVRSMPRAVLIRSIMFNHWYHHRGQLSVYLRLLDVPLPVIYGRSADEDPFA